MRIFRLDPCASPVRDRVHLLASPALHHTSAASLLRSRHAIATWKKTFGHHPLVAFVDHGLAGSGEPVAALLRPGNAGSSTATDHITTAQLALAQLPKHLRRGRQTLIRTDSADGTRTFLDRLFRRGRWLQWRKRDVEISRI